jgi:hypothetical protein
VSDPVELARKYVTLSGEIEDVRRGQGCENPDAHAMHSPIAGVCRARATAIRHVELCDHRHRRLYEERGQQMSVPAAKPWSI